MTPYYQDDQVTLWHGDALDVLPTLGDCTVDSVVCDPPYGLEFMGKAWDAPWQRGDQINAPDAGFGAVGLAGDRLPRPSFTGSTNPACLNCGGKNRGRRDGTAKVRTCVCETPRFPNVRAVEMRAFQEWCEQWATECLRVLKPGAYLVAFGGTRTWHRLACAVEDAGFEIRDSIAWLYGSGFPKSLDVSKAIDKAAGAEREVVGEGAPFGSGSLRNKTRVEMGYRPTELNPNGGAAQVTAPATDAAQQWQGWGTALKPAFEPIVLARKPFRGTVAANVLEHGTGALNIDGCRIEMRDEYDPAKRQRQQSHVADSSNYGGIAGGLVGSDIPTYNSKGRWPANVILDEHTARLVDQQSGVTRDGVAVNRNRTKRAESAVPYAPAQVDPADVGYGGQGGASRFFYTAKAAQHERPNVDGTQHPTVKPLSVMKWLAKLITPPGGLILDPFAGTGTTGEAAIHEHMRCILIEREAEYLPLIVARLTKPMMVGFDFEAGAG